MSKRKLYCIISFLCYLAFTIIGWILGLGAFTDIPGPGEGGNLGTAIAAIFIALIGVLGVAYAIVAIIPLIMKFCDIFFEKRALSIACIVFDVLFILVHILLLVGSIGEGSMPIVSLALLATSALCLTFNILATKQ